MGYGGPSVATRGTQPMPQWCAASLASPLKVRPVSITAWAAEMQNSRHKSPSPLPRLCIAGMQVYTSATRFGEGSGLILLNELQCSGTEQNLLQCVHSGIAINNCLHFQDAGLACGESELPSLP